MNKIKVQIKKMDIFKMQMYLLPRLKINYFWFFFFIAIVGAGSYGAIERQGFLIWFFVIIVFGLTGFVLMSMLCNFMYCLLASEKSGAIGEQLFELNESEFIETSTGTQTRTQWDSIVGFYKRKNYIYIQISGWRIHIIPKRDFINSKEFEDLGILLKQRIKNA